MRNILLPTAVLCLLLLGSVASAEESMSAPPSEVSPEAGQTPQLEAGLTEVEAAAGPARVSLQAELLETLPTESEASEPVEAKASPGLRTLQDWYGMGGPVMHLLAFCSVLVLAISLERAWRLRRSAVFPRRLAADAQAAWSQSDLSGLWPACAEGKSTLARLLREGLTSEQPLQSVAESGKSEVQRLSRNLPLLAALANIATMLGLLGTVLGMIEAFELIAGTGTGDAKVVASGIFRALVTTAAGLGVGIVALALHAVFGRRIEEWTHSLEDFLTHIFGDSPGSDDQLERAPVRAVNSA